MPPITSTQASNPVSRRRSGREGPRELTAAFRRYVERVQAFENPTAKDDLEAALFLAQDIMGHAARTAVDPMLVAENATSIRQLAKSVRRAGRGAVAQPALLARAVVLSRALETPAGSRRAHGRDGELAGTAR
jgi:hypothetical protein